uniref:Sorting nexin family member 21 n=1 Tax=Suricata suricatta TaxID=37032 RepID=A0A673V587_SURSU
MASRLLHRLRHALAGDSPGEAAAGPEAEQFPESSELEDDDAEGLSSRLSGTLSFTSAEDEEEEDDEDDGEIGPDPLPAGDGASGEDAERSPPPDGQRGSQPLTRQLQDFWKKSRNTLVPQRLLFEVTSANVVKDPPSKYVNLRTNVDLYTPHVCVDMRWASASFTREESGPKGEHRLA